MQEVAIVGAGELGGTLASLLARRDITTRIRLIDPTAHIAAGKALDILQSASIDPFATIVSGDPDITRAAGAGVIVLADRAGGGEWQGDDGLQLLAQLARIAAASVVVCAGAEQRELIDRAVRDRLYPRARLFGSAPEALAAAVRAIVALETNGAPAEVALAVMGVPPAHTVIPWEEATIGGFVATGVLDEPSRRRVVARTAALWPPGPCALAAAAVEVVSSVLGYSRRTMSCFVSPEVPAGSGRRVRAAALPVCLGIGGITRINLPALSPHLQVTLDSAMLL
jgi:malate/lactate dehydrogenase